MLKLAQFLIPTEPGPDHWQSHQTVTINAELCQKHAPNQGETNDKYQIMQKGHNLYSLNHTVTTSPHHGLRPLALLVYQLVQSLTSSITLD
jgi:hypothetical protein